MLLLTLLITRSYALPLNPEHLSLSRRETSHISDRSIWDIIWSCFATIFACTWIAVHPNIPGAKDSLWRVFGRRLAIMMYLLIAPEMVILWAARQHFAAVRIGKQFREQGWTTTHAFFLTMGGFELHDDKTFLRVLEVTDFTNLYEQGRIEWPTITVEQIEDRSKADFFSKGVVILQTTWFVVQIIGRGANRLALTELEVVTLAFGILSGVIYWLWWNKPMDVRCPVPIYLKDEKKERTSPTPEEPSDTSGPPEISMVGVITPGDVSGDVSGREDDKRPSSVIASSKPDSRGRSPSLQNVQTPSKFHLLCSYISEKRRERGTFYGLVHVFVTRPLLIFFGPMSDMLSLDTLQGDHSRVPTFYAPKDEADEDTGSSGVVAISAAILFGAIHFVAWSASFPTLAEKWLWRVNAILICTLPILMPFLGTLLNTKKQDEMSFWERIVDDFITAVLGLLLGAYIASRVCLLVQPLVTFRSLSPSAYEDLDWTSYLPHV
ncbi:unnamed protein product [Cyclocybe aegerita]|uniref:Uncharacterized protein n=1 Tax=Cyclocybe aegerita TaxID=1973307 RepID=A0A8S0X0F3_CYCAE|nr:unnamed protein product [Cyclocybe aegerita]